MPGPRPNHQLLGGLGDIAGLRVGHYQRAGRGWLTGTTVVVAPPGTVGGVDVRGAAPGTRETDLLRPGNLVNTVDAVCLTGGSAFGLAAATGVMEELARAGRGFPIAGGTVPIVPAAVIFDLGRGGVFGHHPDAEFGRRAVRATSRRSGEGSIGAGIGARAGGLRGGIGCASIQLANGTRVAVLAVVNAIGRVIDPATGLPFHVDPTLGLRRPNAVERGALRTAMNPLTPPSTSAARSAAASPLNTTIGLVATDARLDAAECSKLAQVAHDGLARAARPAHSMFDGDTIFALATGGCELAAPAGADLTNERRMRAAAVDVLLTAAADIFALAVTRAVVLASGGGPIPAYSELAPSALRVRTEPPPGAARPRRAAPPPGAASSGPGPSSDADADAIERVIGRATLGKTARGRETNRKR